MLGFTVDLDELLDAARSLEGLPAIIGSIPRDPDFQHTKVGDSALATAMNDMRNSTARATDTLAENAKESARRLRQTVTAYQDTDSAHRRRMNAGATADAGLSS
nr:hypothetical protein [Kibdelosporangium sp. MJ126-NF4]CEL14044.1 hypothetical protein [Kibdelosporangium sp. MJ126-NF4]CTQ88410.1 hypothetical protein [Kibdelosporangium sp. MJ126-NF4]